MKWKIINNVKKKQDIKVNTYYTIKFIRAKKKLDEIISESCGIIGDLFSVFHF